MGCRGQEIRIRVINNFCSVINPPRSISASSCHFYVLCAPLCWLLLIPNVHFLVRECFINHLQSILDVKYMMLDLCQALNMSSSVSCKNTADFREHFHINVSINRPLKWNPALCFGHFLSNFCREICDLEFGKSTSVFFNWGPLRSVNCYFTLSGPLFHH